MAIKKKCDLWAFLSIIIFWCLVLSYFNLRFSHSTCWQNLICYKSRVSEGQFWRCLTYIVPHWDIEHLVMDVLYFFIVCCIAIQYFSIRMICISWLLCGLSGGIVFLVFDVDSIGILGSSAATHGLLAFISMVLLLQKQGVVCSIAYSLTVLYLLYTSIYAIMYGVMAWPMTTIRNAGWDHLGGVCMGIVLAVGWFFIKKVTNVR